MSAMAVHYSSATDLWETPQAFFDELNAIFGFGLDVCATPENAKCPRYFTKETDGLAQEWKGVCWMNPPYGREIGQWMAKAYRSALSGATVVCLVPARTDTVWWHDYAAKGEVRFVKGRLKFGDAKNSAPFPSAVIVFRPPMMRPEIYKLLSDNRPLPSGTRIKTTYGGVYTGGDHALLPAALESANRCPNHLSDYCPFWILGWKDLHNDLFIPDSVLSSRNPTHS